MHTLVYRDSRWFYRRAPCKASASRENSNRAIKKPCFARHAHFSPLGPSPSMVQSNQMRRWLLIILCLCPAWIAGAATNESAFLSQIRQLTFEGKTGEGYFSPKGSELIFQSVRAPENPFYQIYLMSLETGDTHRVSPGQ